MGEVSSIELQDAWAKEHLEEDAGINYISVVFSAPGRRWYMEIQLALDEGDVDDGYCLVDSPPRGRDSALADLLASAEHRTVYGGVEECVIHQGSLELTFNAEVRQVFGWPRRLILKLPESQTFDRPGFVEMLKKALLFGPSGNHPRVRNGD